jgi:hypothetical protein
MFVARVPRLLASRLPRTVGFEASPSVTVFSAKDQGSSTDVTWLLGPQRRVLPDNHDSEILGANGILRETNFDKRLRHVGHGCAMCNDGSPSSGTKFPSQSAHSHSEGAEGVYY